MPGGRLPLLRGVSPVPELYSRALSSAYHFEWRIIDPDFSQEKEPDVWELIRRDGKIAQAIMQRTSTVASKNWSVEPGGDGEKDAEVASWCEEILEGIPDFRESRKCLAQGIFRGRSYGFVTGRRELAQYGNLPAKRWWVPTRIQDIDKRRVQIVPEVDHKRKKTKLSSHKELWSVAEQEWLEISPSGSRQLIELVYSDEEGRLGYGRGLLDSLYFLYWAKHSVLKEGLQAIERWAQGFILAKVDPDKAGAAGTDTLTNRNAMRNEIQKHRGKHVLVVDKTDEVDMVRGGGEGYQIVRDMVNYLDESIMGVAMGSVLPFGVGEATGSMARAQVEEEVSDELLEFDRGKLDEVLTRKLIRLIYDANRPQLSEVGYLQARLPKFKTSQAKRDDPEKNARVVQVALQTPGIKLKRDEVYEKLGFTVPADGDEVIEGGQAAALGFPQPGGGFAQPSFGQPQNGNGGSDRGGGFA